MIVRKFGGTSVQDAEAMRRVTDIVRSFASEPSLIVLSACAGVTDVLMRIARLAPSGRCDEAFSLVDTLQARHRVIVDELFGISDGGEARAIVDQSMDEVRTFVTGVAIVGEASPRSFDHLASIGEVLSSRILHAELVRQGGAAVWMDARSLLVTDDNFTCARPLLDETRIRLLDRVQPILSSGSIVVTQGFVGGTVSGITTTVGRGGSDYSASIFGSLLAAKEIQIWTDVDGILTADPGIIHEARRIRLMSFREAAELSYFGARVLHPETIRPAVDQGIPVRVLNSRKPGTDGTLIVKSDRSPEGCRVKSVAYKEGITVVTVVSEKMFLSHSFLEEVFDILNRHQSVVHTVAASDVSVSVTMNGGGMVDEIVAELSTFASVTVARHKALVAVVGEGLRASSGIAARIFGALGDENVNMISQGASEVNVSFVVDESRITEVVRKLHGELFSDSDRYPEVFA